MVNINKDLDLKKMTRDTFSEPYVLLLSKLCHQLECMEESKPKSQERLKNFLYNKCFVTQFYPPFQLLASCSEETVQLKIGDKLVPKKFYYYKPIDTSGEENCRKSFKNLYKHLQYKNNAFPLNIDETAYAKIRESVLDLFAAEATGGAAHLSRHFTNLRNSLIRKCILIQDLNPNTLVRDLQQAGFIQVSQIGEVEYNMQHVESYESDLESSIELYLMGKLRLIKDLPKTELALVNVIKPFTHVIQSVDPGEFMQIYPKMKNIFQQFAKIEFGIEPESWLTNSSGKEKQKKFANHKKRGKFKVEKSRNRTEANEKVGCKSLLNVLLRSNEILESCSRKWNAPLSPCSLEEGASRVAEWMESKISNFEKGYVSNPKALLYEALQCGLYRKLIPADTVLQKLEQYEIICTHGDRVEYDFTKMDSLKSAEKQVNNYLNSDARIIAEFRNKLGMPESRSVIGKRRGVTTGRGRGRGRRAKRLRY